MYEAVRDDRQRYGFHRDVNRFKNRTDESAPCHGPSQAPGAPLWFYGFVVHLTCTVQCTVCTEAVQESSGVRFRWSAALASDRRFMKI